MASKYIHILKSGLILMPRDHFVPACFIGRFSTDTNTVMRQRRVWVVGHRRNEIRREKADNVGAINNYYRLTTMMPEPNMVGDTWLQYESRLNEALDELIDPAVASVDANVWLRVLVPFVAGIFVRTPDFVRKFEGDGRMLDDLLAAGNILRPDNTNMARLISLQRVLAPIMAAKWVVAHARGSEPLITNDLGYVVNRFAPYDSIGWTIPLGRMSALQLVPCPDGRQRDILFYAGKESGWRAFIEHATLPQDNHLGLNRSVSQFAHEFILGPTRCSVENQLQEFRATYGSADTFSPQMLTSHRMQTVHEFEWFRLVSALQFAPSDVSLHNFDIDWNEVVRDWTLPSIMIPTNLPRFETGLRLHGKTIALGMSEVPGFTDYAPGPWPWEPQSSGDS